MNLTWFTPKSQLPFGLIAKCDTWRYDCALQIAPKLSQLPFGLIAKCDTREGLPGAA